LPPRAAGDSEGHKPSAITNQSHPDNPAQLTAIKTFYANRCCNEAWIQRNLRVFTRADPFFPGYRESRQSVPQPHQILYGLVSSGSFLQNHVHAGFFKRQQIAGSS
jgi:hypothetical protein